MKENQTFTNLTAAIKNYPGNFIKTYSENSHLLYSNYDVILQMIIIQTMLITLLKYFMDIETANGTQDEEEFELIEKELAGKIIFFDYLHPKYHLDVIKNYSEKYLKTLLKSMKLYTIKNILAD